MRKDYLLVAKSRTQKKEIDFVEKFWTERWQKQSIDKLVNNKIEKEAEYPILNNYLKRLPKKSRVLDGGCGMGQWTTYYSSKGLKTTGLDISRETIKRLQSKFPDEDFVTGDIRKMKFKSNSFDAYFSWGTFEHFESGLDECFIEAKRVLKNKGWLIITVPYYNARLRIKDSFNFGNKSKAKTRFYQWRLTKPELRHELERHGFKVEVIEPIHKAHGLRRLIQHDLKIKPSNWLHRLFLIVLYPIIPKRFTAHMLMAVAYK